MTTGLFEKHAEKAWLSISQQSVDFVLLMSVATRSLDRWPRLGGGPAAARLGRCSYFSRARSGPRGAALGERLARTRSVPGTPPAAGGRGPRTAPPFRLSRLPVASVPGLTHGLKMVSGTFRKFPMERRPASRDERPRHPSLSHPARSSPSCPAPCLWVAS